MASCVRTILAKNYQKLITGFQVTLENVGDVFFEIQYIISLCAAVKNWNHLCVYVGLFVNWLVDVQCTSRFIPLILGASWLLLAGVIRRSCTLLHLTLIFIFL